MRSILVFADRSAASPARLETALSLARMTDGHVSVLVDTPVARFMSMDAMGGSYIAADAISDALARDDAYAEEVAAHLRDAGRSARRDQARIGNEQGADRAAAS